MTRSTVSPPIQYPNLDNLLQNLEKDTTDRRKSVLVFNKDDEEDDAEDAWAIVNISQLQSWAETKFTAVLTMLNELREQRDLGLKATRLYNRINDKDQEKDAEYKARYEAAQKKIEKQRKKFNKLDKELAKVNTVLEILQAERDFSTLLNIFNKDHRKWVVISDSSYLTNGKESTFEEWLIAMRDKLSVQEDDFRDELHQIAYVCSRTQGRAAKVLEVRRRPDTQDSFDSVQEVFDDLKEQLVDSDRKQNVKRNYQLLEQGSMPITDFFLKFQEYAFYLRKPDDDMILDAAVKFNSRMKSWADNLQESFISFSKFRKRAIQIDNNHQATRRAREYKDDPRPRAPAKVLFASARVPAAPLSKYIPRPRVREGSDQQQDADAKDGNCFTCHKPGHLSPDCPQKKFYTSSYRRERDTRVNAIHGTSENEDQDNYYSSDKDSLYSDTEN